MKRQQVFVRAQDDTGRWGSCDVLDLDDESFRIFVAGVLFRAEIVVGIKDEQVAGEHLKLRMRQGLRYNAEGDAIPVTLEQQG